MGERGAHGGEIPGTGGLAVPKAAWAYLTAQALCRARGNRREITVACGRLVNGARGHQMADTGQVVGGRRATGDGEQTATGLYQTCAALDGRIS